MSERRIVSPAQVLRFAQDDGRLAFDGRPERERGTWGAGGANPGRIAR